MFLHGEAFLCLSIFFHSVSIALSFNDRSVGYTRTVIFLPLIAPCVPSGRDNWEIFPFNQESVVKVEHRAERKERPGRERKEEGMERRKRKREHG